MAILIMFDDQNKVESILNDMRSCVKNYGYVTVCDLFDLLDVKTVYSDNQYGWVDLSDGCVHSFGCVMKLPDIIPIGGPISITGTIDENVNRYILERLNKLNDNVIDGWKKAMMNTDFPAFHEVLLGDVKKITSKDVLWDNFESNLKEKFGNKIPESNISMLDDHSIIPSMMSEEVFPPRRIKNYSEESGRRHPRRSDKHPYNSTVDHPQHYQSETGLEVIDVIDAFTDGLNGVEAFDTGNIIKYICRWKKKNGIEDLEKAKWYLENLIKNVKEKENEDVK